MEFPDRVNRLANRPPTTDAVLIAETPEHLTPYARRADIVSELHR